jgi:hypothetical protein
MATSYLNVGGKGDRTNIVFGSHLGAGYISGGGLGPPAMLNGSYANACYMSGNANTHEFLFQFEWPVIIDEITWYQSAVQTHGVWQVKGSNDNVNWDNIGATFTLGGATTQEITTLAPNTTPYKYYKLTGISGVTSTTPYLQEIEFKLIWSPIPTTSFTFIGGMGDRTAIITVTTDLTTLFYGPINKLVNGVIDTDMYWTSQDITGKQIKFDFGVPKLITEARWIQSAAGTKGVWKCQGSTNDSDWVDIGGSVELGVAAWTNILTLNGNTVVYRYLRLLGVSGTSGTARLGEVQFQIGDPAESAAIRMFQELLAIEYSAPPIVKIAQVLMQVETAPVSTPKRTFPLPSPYTVWQSQLLKRQFPN